MRTKQGAEVRSSTTSIGCDRSNRVRSRPSEAERRRPSTRPIIGRGLPDRATSVITVSRSMSYCPKLSTYPLRRSASARPDPPCPRQSNVTTAKPRLLSSRTVSKYFLCSPPAPEACRRRPCIAPHSPIAHIATALRRRSSRRQMTRHRDIGLLGVEPMALASDDLICSAIVRDPKAEPLGRFLNWKAGCSFLLLSCCQGLRLLWLWTWGNASIVHHVHSLRHCRAAAPDCRGRLVAKRLVRAPLIVQGNPFGDSALRSRPSA